MKALPVKLTPHDGYAECAADEATHLTLMMPGPTRRLTLPVLTRGTRAGTRCWTWNGSVDAPTLRPSVLTEGYSSGQPFRCHSWVNDGKVQFLDDCSHELRNTTVELLPVHGSNKE